MSANHDCQCRNPVGGWSDRQLRCKPRILFLMALVSLYAAVIEPPSPRHAAVAFCGLVFFGALWIYLWYVCRQEHAARLKLRRHDECHDTYPQLLDRQGMPRRCT